MFQRLPPPTSTAAAAETCIGPCGPLKSGRHISGLVPRLDSAFSTAAAIRASSAPPCPSAVDAIAGVESPVSKSSSGIIGFVETTLAPEELPLRADDTAALAWQSILPLCVFLCLSAPSIRVWGVRSPVLLKFNTSNLDLFDYAGRFEKFTRTWHHAEGAHGDALAGRRGWAGRSAMGSGGRGAAMPRRPP